MDILIVSRTRGQTWRTKISPRSPWFIVPALLLPLVIVGSSIWFGYHLAPEVRGVSQVLQATQVWDDEVNVQRQQIAGLRQKMDDNIHALSQRLGQLQANVTRINAAGARMAQVAKLDAGEFDFNSPPPIGGPETDDAGPTPTVDDLSAELDRFSHELDSRERQMRVLRDLMVAGELRNEVMPSGEPIKKGWISSGYGVRIDPFTGHKASHWGIDFAAPSGSNVIAVASGVVSYSGPRSGYGNLLEINHGNGYVTRYGHNKKLLVHEGDRVDKGEVVAKVGATGRATGPHVHFEVWHNGKRVNPSEYIQASR